MPKPVPRADPPERPSSADASPEGSVGALTGAVARGDPEALGRLYDAWFDRCYLMARRLTRRDEAFCLDVVQEAMLRVARSIRRIETETQLERWMARVVHTVALDLIRKERRRVARERRRGHPVVATAPAASEEQVRWLRAQLDSLGPDERAILSLRFVREQTLDQAGDAVGMTGDAAHGKLRRILRRLRGAAGEEARDD